MLDEDGFFTISLRSLGRQHVHARTSFRRRSVRVQPRRRGDEESDRVERESRERHRFPFEMFPDVALNLRIRHQDHRLLVILALEKFNHRARQERVSPPHDDDERGNRSIDVGSNDFVVGDSFRSKLVELLARFNHLARQLFALHGRLQFHIEPSLTGDNLREPASSQAFVTGRAVQVLLHGGVIVALALQIHAIKG